MIIGGSGTMTNYEQNTQPWNSYRNSIKEIVVEEGITSVGSYAFYDMSNLKMIVLMATELIIGPMAINMWVNL